MLCNLEEDLYRRGNDSDFSVSSRSNVSPKVASRKSSAVEGKAAEECRLWLVPCRADCTAGYGVPCYSCATMSFLESSRWREHASNPSFSGSVVVVVGSSLDGKLNVIPPNDAARLPQIPDRRVRSLAQSGSLAFVWLSRETKDNTPKRLQNVRLRKIEASTN